MPNDYEVNVILTEHPTHWAWKVKCLGQFVASGSAVSLERALRIARQYSIGKYTEHCMAHYLYGANINIH